MGQRHAATPFKQETGTSSFGFLKYDEFRKSPATAVVLAVERQQNLKIRAVGELSTGWDTLSELSRRSQ